ncbi:TetR/AcrR family transcriptional regulator [Cellulomonas fimi]|uniref:TetR/AcrR family transcriptional regulator n=1 Tax=Cellulomonas fimi TaxID=1708 RepID=UPI0027E0C15A|nr:TetR family transcriptional regulator [Cellulomonas fimi]
MEDRDTRRDDGREVRDTRALVRATALRLFRERGYAATTMRLVAQEAGVATGNAYYHFASKDHLVQELYLDVTQDHARRSASVLAAGGDLATRLRGVLHAGLDAFDGYHAFGTEFVTVAIRPTSAASPFSAASGGARATSEQVFREVVEGAAPAVPRHLRADLPELLWLAQLGVTLFWVHDGSPGQRRTRALVDGAAPLVGRLVSLARLPVARRVTDDLLRLVREAMRPDDEGEGAAAAGGDGGTAGRAARGEGVAPGVDGDRVDDGPAGDGSGRRAGEDA